TVTGTNVLTGFNGLVVGSAQANGAGTVVLAAAQDYQGNTTVANGGTLVLGGALTGPGAVTVQSGGTLAGSGPVGGATTVSGTVSPGSSPGTLTFANGVAFAAGGRYAWELAALTTGGAGTNWDQVAV